MAEEIVAYDLNNMTLALYPFDKLMADAKLTFEKPLHSAVTIAYNVRTEDEVDSILAEAVKAGGMLVKAGEKVFGAVIPVILPTPTVICGRSRIILWHRWDRTGISMEGLHGVIPPA